MTTIDATLPEDPLAYLLTDEFFHALFFAETQDRAHPNGDIYAVGDKHLPPDEWAYGPFQIRKPYVTDVNKKFGTKYTSEAMKGNWEDSVDAVKKYMSIYATQKRLGRPVTVQDIFRIHNGGPAGWKSIRTLAYWRKAEKLLSK